MSSFYHSLKDLMLGTLILIDALLDSYAAPESERKIAANAIMDMADELVRATASGHGLEAILSEAGIEPKPMNDEFRLYMSVYQQKMNELLPADWDAEIAKMRETLDIEELMEWYADEDEDGPDEDPDWKE